MRKLEWLVVLMPVAIAGVMYASNCEKLRTSSRDNSNNIETLESVTSTISYLPPVGPAPITPPVVSPHLDQSSGESPFSSCVFKCEDENGMGIYAESCIEDCFKKYNY